MKQIGIALMVAGIAMVSWFGYQYWSSTQSVTELDNDVVKDSTETEKKEENSNSDDDFTLEDGGKAEDKSQSDVDYDDGDDIARLVMPSIDLSFEVFWGTGEDALSKGVGMYDSEFTKPPGSDGHTVLSGHRDSVFAPVGDLEDGDSIYVNYKDEDYEYKIKKTWITDAADRSVIVEKDDPTLTLTTCYPFKFIGSAPDRYIVEAEFVQKGDLLNLD